MSSTREYPVQNDLQVKESQVNRNDPNYVNIVNSLSLFEGDLLKGYNWKETDVIKLIIENLNMLDTFEPLNTDNFLPIVRHQRYRFLQSIKKKGLPRPIVVLFCQEYGSSFGYTYFICKESVAEWKETERCFLIQSIKSILSKYFSLAHKRKAKEKMHLLMMEKITRAQFRSIYGELTGDNSVSDN